VNCSRGPHKSDVMERRCPLCTSTADIHQGGDYVRDVPDNGLIRSSMENAPNAASRIGVPLLCLQPLS
jgi:hypothetical protein